MKKLKQNNWIWWKHGVIYHIYPRSFCDTNHDGIGDLNGIIHKLDYLRELGIDAIWLSPVFKSPQIDFGYDISDFYSIDPDYGTMNHFRKLLKEAHKREIRVVIDFILNHTSNQHPWFIEACSDTDSLKRKWYLWRTGNGSKPPNNWKTSFGGTAWEYHAGTNQYYYHSFFKEQPDLNWRNKDLKKEMFRIAAYWLDIGVDGFRLDVANFIIKDKKYRDNPSFLKMFWNRKKIYTRNRPRSIKTIQELRKILNKYDNRMMVGEIFTLPPGDSGLAAKYLGNGKDTLHLAFDFSLIFTPWSAQRYARVIQRWYDIIPEKGWPCNVLSNHDLHRNYNRLGKQIFKQKKAIVSAFLLLTMKGTPFIYYGEEIGMSNTRIPRKEIKDPVGKKFWPFYKGRDKARTPMQWNQKKYAGFSKKKPWLPVHKGYKKTNVVTQKKLKNSVYYYYKNLIQLRKSHDALYKGKFELLKMNNKGILAYKRTFRNSSFIIVLNFTAFRKKIKLKNHVRTVFSTHRKADNIPLFDLLKLFPFEATILEELT